MNKFSIAQSFHLLEKWLGVLSKRSEFQDLIKKSSISQGLNQNQGLLKTTAKIQGLFKVVRTMYNCDLVSLMGSQTLAKHFCLAIEIET